MEERLSDISAPIQYVRSPRAKYLRITVSPAPAVKVTVPLRATLEEARRFVASRRRWIFTHLERMAARQRLEAQQTPPDLSGLDLAAAQEELFSRLEAYAAKYGLHYRRAAFRCQKTKWGSCSSQNTLSFNINMVFLPRHLQDYLLLHELAHIRHKNHSPAFWAELDRLCGGRAKAMAQELKGHKLHILT